MPDQQSPARAPELTLEHVLGHSVSLSDYAGRRHVVVFGGRESAPQVQSGIELLRRRYDPDELPIVSISDLEAVPRPARIIAKTQLKKAFAEAVEDQNRLLRATGKQPADDPARDVVMLMDWKGEAAPAFGFSDVSNTAAAVVVDPDGSIVGSGSGSQLGEEIVAALER